MNYRKYSRREFLGWMGAGMSLSMFLFGMGFSQRSGPAGSQHSETRYQEKFRPQFHFTPVRNWMNDPNGLVYSQGEYHLFFQHNPSGPRWGNMTWGHAVSPDLVHWIQLEHALHPDELGTIFSGSAVVDHRNTSGFFPSGTGLVAIFTHHQADPRIERQSIAYSRDNGRTWAKYEGNPVIPNFGDENFRDPKVLWYEPEEKWVMVVAGGRVRFYESRNLRTWRFLSINEDIETECPDFFELPVDGHPQQTKWVLSLAGREYLMGEFDGRFFIPDQTSRPVIGPEPYASQTFSDISEDDGRRVNFDWMHPRSFQNQYLTDPWTGMMSLPQSLELRSHKSDLVVTRAPVKELHRLRGKHYQWKEQTAAPNTNLLSKHRGTSLEIRAEFEPIDSAECGFVLRKNTDQETVVGYHTGRREVFVDRRRSGAGDIKPEYAVLETPEPLQGDQITLHLFLDSCSLEVFVNGGVHAFLCNIFPDPEADDMTFYTLGGDVRIHALDIWELHSSWD